MKKKIQLVQVNNSYGNQYFIPYSAGLLQAYCNQFKQVEENFDFLKIVYKQEDDLDKQVRSLGKLDVVGQSCYVWNWKFNLAFAKMVRKYNPKALIVLGGPQVPDDSTGFFEKYPFIDILCHGEGELVFNEILKEHMGGNDYGLIEGVTYNDRNNKKIFDVPRRTRAVELEDIPSPYLDGTFYDLMMEDVMWQASWETNRGCPYRCTFCNWGSEYYNKIRKFSFEDRLKKEINWFSENKINLIFGCDANFGVFKRDVDIAQALVVAKESTGYPKKFRVCNAKNSNERVFKISEILNKASMAKGTSVSVQSMDEDTLSAINRKNIGIDKFRDLMSRFNKSSMPTYTEVILALPGETYNSFIAGLDTLLHAGQHSQIYIYNCTVLGNSEMSAPEYVEEHKIETVEVPIFQSHVDIKASTQIQEMESIVIGTKTMPRQDWEKCSQYSWTVQTFHTMGLLQYIAIAFVNVYGCNYSDFYSSLVEYAYKNRNSLFGIEVENSKKSLDSLLSGKEYGQLVPSYGLDIFWPPEEASFLRLSENIDIFYDEVSDFVEYFLEKFNFSADKDFLKNLLELQKEVVVNYRDEGQTSRILLNYNLDNYVRDIQSGLSTKLIKYSNPKDCAISKSWKRIEADNKKEFARNIVWYGRKGGKFINKFINIDEATYEKSKDISHSKAASKDLR